MFLSFLNSDDHDAERIYLEHIKRRAGAHYPLGTYLPAAKTLFRSMQSKGFDERYAVAVNRNYIFLEGAHRTSSSLVLGIKMPVRPLPTDKTWPSWGREWFIENEMGQELPWMEKALTEITNGND